LILALASLLGRRKHLEKISELKREHEETHLKMVRQRANYLGHVRALEVEADTAKHVEQGLLNTIDQLTSQSTT
jgi:hypothetical protein